MECLIEENKKLKGLLKDFLDNIDLCKGHGMPVFKDRGIAYSTIVLAEIEVKR